MTYQHQLFPTTPTGEIPRTKELCEEYNAYQTPRWAIKALLKSEYPQCLQSAKRSQTLRVLDPCYGLGAITRAIYSECPNAKVRAGDVLDWSKRPYLHLGDFLAPNSRDWIKDWLDARYRWDCIMNPPFQHSVEFIERALALGANKVCVFEKSSFFGAKSRKVFWDTVPLSKILYCAQRASCKRFDLVNKDLSSATHDHAWFVFEPYAKNSPNTPTIERIYK